MNEERLQEIKDSVDFQREMLLAHNLGTLCVDEEQELIDEIERLKEQLNDEIDDELKQSEIMVKKQEEIERLNNIINELEQTLEKLIKEQLEQYNKREENWEERKGVSNTWLTSRDCYYSILKYLQKLKGSVKE